MSWSEPAQPLPGRGLRPKLASLALAGLMLAGAAMLGGCSFSPVYSGALASQPLLNLAFSKPNTRLEQVVNQELALRFGVSDAATAPLATVRASSSGGTIALSETRNPNKANRVTVNATLTLQRRDGSGAPPVSFTRQASAEYTTNGQVLADQAAATDAAERAARAAAESLRLGLLASLSR